MKSKLAIAPPMNVYVLNERGKETKRMNLPIMLNKGDSFKLGTKQYKVDAISIGKTQAELQCNATSMFHSMECHK
jgi:hypothetical protein